jgi:hypothetical protein
MTAFLLYFCLFAWLQFTFTGDKQFLGGDFIFSMTAVPLGITDRSVSTFGSVLARDKPAHPLI